MTDIGTIEWPAIKNSLDNKGFAVVKSFLGKDECEELIAIYQANIFRKVINMKRYRFGDGEYKYFKYPLPDSLQHIRENLYSPLSVVANQWMADLRIDQSYPENHKDFIKICNEKGQVNPTPLILKYERGGHNTLHQDLYGEVFFPFQAVIVLSERDRDFEGGEFVMTEQIPRAQSKANVIDLHQGDVLILTTNFRPVKSTRGYYRAAMKHGVSEIKSGTRYALGIIFHDAQ